LALPQRRSLEEIEKASDGYTARTIPVHVEVDARQTVLTEPEAEEILRRATRIALGPCGCRKSAGKCDAPLDTCLALDEAADDVVAKDLGFRDVSIERALATLRTSHEEGLVHLAYRQRDAEISMFCSCCSCCCGFLSKLREFDYHDVVAESAYIARHSPERCVGCGACVERCQFDAWRTNGAERPTFIPKRCFGCGLCVSSCPAEAIALVARSEA
jgi:NAD-dependent dihydropyrimidine dehydrogenase PreA subunit